MTVEAALANDTAAEQAAIAPVDSAAAPASEDAQMEEVWSRLHPEDRVERGEGGKFVSRNPDAGEGAEEAPLEGGEGGEQEADASTVAADVPLPANWVGKDALWAKLPADVKAEIAEHQREQHAKLSDFGRKAAVYEPLQQAASEFAEYFNGNIKDGEGNPIHPADGIRYLANIQRQMDRDPVNTLMSIIDTYGAREHIAAALGVAPGDGKSDPGQQNQALLQTIGRLEATIRELTDPQRIGQVVDQKTAMHKHEEEVSRLTSSKPLYDRIPEQRMVFFINEAWQALGPQASKADVFDHAYNAAVEADPALRALSQAATVAAKDNAAKAGEARRAASVNVRSTGSGKPRQRSDEELMEEVWAKYN